MRQTTLAYYFGAANSKKFSDSGTSTPPLRRLPSAQPVNNDSKQLVIDAGQKRFAVECCTVCRMPYNPDHAEDVKEHAKYHARVTGPLVRVASHLAGKLHVVAQFLDGYIVRLELDRINKSTKLLAQDVLLIACREAGDCAQTLMDSRKPRQMYVFISSETNQSVKGVVVAEVTSKVQRAGADGRVKDQTKSLAIGILLIWVSSCSRRKGIATRLVDTARANFLPGSKLVDADVAFADPTEMGTSFAKSYCGTNDILLFRI